MTLKQKRLIDKIIDYFGKEKVEEYISYFYPKVNIEELKKEEAQKIITGLYHKLPKKPIICSNATDYIYK